MKEEKNKEVETKRKEKEHHILSNIVYVILVLIGISLVILLGCRMWERYLLKEITFEYSKNCYQLTSTNDSVTVLDYTEYGSKSETTYYFEQGKVVKTVNKDYHHTIYSAKNQFMLVESQFKNGTRIGLSNISLNKNVITYEYQEAEPITPYFSDLTEEDKKVKEQFLNSTSNEEAISMFIKQVEKYMKVFNSEKIS